MEHQEISLIKSFQVISDIGISKVGDIITLRQYQANIPLKMEEMYFKNIKNSHTFTFNFLLSQLDEKIVVFEKFKTLEQKFKYLKTKTI